MLGDTQSLWGGCFWATGPRGPTQELFAQPLSQHGFRPSQQKLNSLQENEYCSTLPIVSGPTCA